MKRLASVTLTILLIFCTMQSAFADTATATTMRLEAATGTVTVKNASGVGQTVRDGMRLYNGYEVSTAAASEAYISLDSSKAVKLGASGKIQVKRSGKQLEVSVSAGELFFNVTAPLKTDESLNVRTSTMVTGVRGSFGWVKPGETGLMHGSVILTGADISVTLVSGQLARSDGTPSPISSADVPTLVAREMRDHPELLEQVKRDVPSIDTEDLMEHLDARIEQERKAEQAAQTDLEARRAQETNSENSGSASSGRSGSGGGSGGGSSSSSSGGGNIITRYAVTYRDNADGTVFPDDTHSGLLYGTATPPYSGGVPTRPGYTFTGWYPAVTPFVRGNAVYTAQWTEAVNPPDEPDTPDNPDEPDKPDTPDNPDEPDTPDTPDNPDEPDNPDTPDNPDEPDNPDTPDNPDEPDKPDTPDTPDEPDKPDTPDTPDNPDEPDNPDTPDNPDEPDKPDTPDTPDEPDKPDTPDTPDEPDTPDTPDTPDEPDNPDIPDKPDEPDKPGKRKVTFRVPENALLTILNGVTKEGIVEISGNQELELERGDELYLCLTRPDPESGDRVFLPFRVLVDGKETDGVFLRVTRNMTVDVVETKDSPSDTSRLLQRVSVSVTVPQAYRNIYGETVSMSFTPDENNVIMIPSFLSLLPRFGEWETKIRDREVTVSMELTEGASAFPDAEKIATVGDCYDLLHKGLIVSTDSQSQFYWFRFSPGPYEGLR